MIACRGYELIIATRKRWQVEPILQVCSVMLYQRASSIACFPEGLTNSKHNNISMCQCVKERTLFYKVL